MRNVTRAITVAASCALLVAGGAALSAGTVRQAPAAPAHEQEMSPATSPASIDSLAFLAGTWIGDMNGSYVEETWSRPQGNNIIGHFRWLRPDGKPIIFEILTITEENDLLRLRLRHYSATLIGKEEQDKPMTLRLATLEAARVTFKAEQHAGDLTEVVYEVVDDKLTITIDLGDVREPLVFNLQRMR